MSQVIINTIKSISTTDCILHFKGQFRAISKCRGGFFVVSDRNAKNAERAIDVLRSYEKGALQTIQFNPYGTEIWLTVFARNGKKVILMDKQLFEDITVGDINQCFSNTNLRSAEQYAIVNAKTWADKAFVMNPAK
jgi:hypothetical protein